MVAGLLLVGAAFGALPLAAADHTMTSAIFAETRGKYERKKLPDGTFQPEYYALSYGGVIAGSTSDSSMEKLEIATLNRVLRQHLESQRYFLAPDSSAAGLLLVVNWGRTIPFNGGNYSDVVNRAGAAMNTLQDIQRAAGAGVAADPQASEQAAADMEYALMLVQMQNQDRRRANEQNARLLGYLKAVSDRDDIRRFAGGQTAYDDLISDLEESRYYVIISAYDFRAVTAAKKLGEPLWIAKISIRAQGHRFDEQLNEMVARMSRYFGRDSRGLVRKFEGTVEFGEAVVIGVEEETLPPERKTSPSEPVPAEPGANPAP